MPPSGLPITTDRPVTTGDDARRSQPPAGVVLRGSAGPVRLDQRTLPVRCSTAKMRPPRVAAVTSPSATAGEASTLRPAPAPQSPPPLPRSPAYTRPPPPPTNPCVGVGAGEEGPAPPVWNRQRIPPCPVNSSAPETPECSGLPRNITAGPDSCPRQ